MEFKMPESKPRLAQTLSPIQIGNIYKCKGGAKTSYWIVVGENESTVNLIGINDAGKVTSTANYGRHVFESSMWSRDIIGYCHGLQDMAFDIEWT